MKLYKLMLAPALALTMSACGDLDAEPGGNNVTSSQKQEAVESNPALAAAGVSGIFGSLNQYMSVYSSAHCDFGWPATIFGTDAAGMDLVTYNTGYNWFSSWAGRSFGGANNYPTNLAWYHAYKVILAANTVLAPLGDDISDPELQLYAAQALGERSFMFFELLQLYQRTYIGNEQAPGIPIITEKNSNEAAAEGCSRGTLESCYAQVLGDLTKAIEYLSGCGLDVDHISSSGSKRYISLGTAYGLRARVNLVMGNWADAESDARNAIAKSGAVPASIEDVSRPYFGSMDESNWMWGIYLSENDRVVTSAIVNWGSFMGSLNYGYAQAGAWVRINRSLYNTIPTTDVRSGWWLDAERQSANLNAAEKAYFAGGNGSGAPAFTQVKFMPYNNQINTTVNANDIPMMRVEEMYYIVAEALARQNRVTDAVAYLNSFVQAYRDPSFNCKSTAADAVVDEIWHQRRIELWGEGISYFDLLRLNKGIDRRGAGFDAVWVYNIPSPLPSFLIPEREVANNKQLGVNNDPWDTPTAVADN